MRPCRSSRITPVPPGRRSPHAARRSPRGPRPGRDRRAAAPRHPAVRPPSSAARRLEEPVGASRATGRRCRGGRGRRARRPSSASPRVARARASAASRAAGTPRWSRPAAPAPPSRCRHAPCRRSVSGDIAAESSRRREARFGPARLSSTARRHRRSPARTARCPLPNPPPHRFAGRVPAGVEPVIPGPGQESVWDYPRPPRIGDRRRADPGRGRRHGDRRLRIAPCASSRRRAPPCTTSRREDVRMDLLAPTLHSTHCEWKGDAALLVCHGRRPRSSRTSPGLRGAAGQASSRSPATSRSTPSRVDEAWVGDERATPQPGGFYGGWVRRGSSARSRASPDPPAGSTLRSITHANSTPNANDPAG